MLTNPAAANSLTQSIIGCAIRVHRAIGPGLYENVYAECLQHELEGHGLQFERERPAVLTYRGVTLNAKYYVDFVVQNLVIVELKAVAELTQIHERQVLTQLKLTGLPVGLLINFNVTILVNGLKRIVNPDLKRRETENI